MGKDSTVIVIATGMKAFIKQILAAGVIQIECITTGQKFTLLESEVKPFKLMH